VHIGFDITLVQPTFHRSSEPFTSLADSRLSFYRSTGHISGQAETNVHLSPV